MRTATTWQRRFLMHAIKADLLPVKTKHTRAATLLLTLLASITTLALDLQNLNVTKEGRTYKIRMTFSITSSPDKVMAILTDYSFPDRLNPKVTARQIISLQNGITRVRTEIQSCVFVFCKDVALIQDITIIANTIQADIVPDKSDFRSGTLRWSVTSGDDGGSQIAFDANMEPDFFIPPLIGGYFVRKRLRQEILATAQRLEIEAMQESDHE